MAKRSFSNLLLHNLVENGLKFLPHKPGKHQNPRAQELILALRLFQAEAVGRLSPVLQHGSGERSDMTKSLSGMLSRFFHGFSLVAESRLTSGCIRRQALEH
jgi:hypothetical protein